MHGKLGFRNFANSVRLFYSTKLVAFLMSTRPNSQPVLCPRSTAICRIFRPPSPNTRRRPAKQPHRSCLRLVDSIRTS